MSRSYWYISNIKTECENEKVPIELEIGSVWEKYYSICVRQCKNKEGTKGDYEVNHTKCIYDQIKNSELKDKFFPQINLRHLTPFGEE